MVDSAAPASEFPSPHTNESREDFIERLVEHITMTWRYPFIVCGHEVPELDPSVLAMTRKQGTAIFDVHERLKAVPNVR